MVLSAVDLKVTQGFFSLGFLRQTKFKPRNRFKQTKIGCQDILAFLKNKLLRKIVSNLLTDVFEMKWKNNQRTNFFARKKSKKSG